MIRRRTIGLGGAALVAALLGLPGEARAAGPATGAIARPPRSAVASIVAPTPSLTGLFFPPLVSAGPVPVPDDTIAVVASEAYLGEAATGRGFVLLAPGHTTLTQPILVVEGFDLDNSMDWDELYTLLNQEALVESLQADGYDAVVLDFADATDHIQRNAFVFTALLAQVEAAIDPGQTLPVVGASMGGLVARYGLAWLEAHAIPHRVRTFVSFDAPQAGANIPLGLQHWVDFFASQSAAADTFRGILASPAARQMLVTHFGSTVGTSAAADPLRATLLADLAAVGGYPAAPRRVAFANGAGNGVGQGYAAGAQLIDYDFDNLLVLVRGDVWAVPAVGPAQVFAGRIRILFVSDTVKNVSVANTRAWDNAPGGWRASLAQLDTTQAPFGDIHALHDAHAFIPTVSALDADVGDLFRDFTLLPDPAGVTPFDAVHWAATNEEHVFISPATAALLRAELAPPFVGVDAPTPALAFGAASPNPAAASATLRFALPAAGPATLEVLDVTGRRVRVLATGAFAAGPQARVWDLRDDAGRRVRPGLYFVRLAAAGTTRAQRLIVLPPAG